MTSQYVPVESEEWLCVSSSVCGRPLNKTSITIKKILFEIFNIADPPCGNLDLSNNYFFIIIIL